MDTTTNTTTKTNDGGRFRAGRLALGVALALLAGTAGCDSGARQGAARTGGAATGEAGGAAGGPAAGEERAMAAQTAKDRAVAYFAGGCFWGVEYYFEKEPGVLDVVSGYMGGRVDDPSYEQVCSGRTGHVETVKVVYDPTKTDFETLAKLFFEIHDPTQVNRQGPDIGEQYRSAVFVTDAEQRRATERLIGQLRERGYDVATAVEEAGPFWEAEGYHQDYYERTGLGTQHCGIVRTDRFGREGGHDGDAETGGAGPGQ